MLELILLLSALVFVAVPLFVSMYMVEDVVDFFSRERKKEKPEKEPLFFD